MAVIKVGNNNIGKISVIEPYDNPLTNPSSAPRLDTSTDRPSGWLEIPPLQDGMVNVLLYVPSGYKDFGVGLFARNGVYNNCPTHIPIDWGDGHSGIFYGTRSDNGNYSGNFGSKYKKYDYDLLPPSTEIEVNNFPCRQVLIRLDGTVSGITYFDLTRLSGYGFGDTADYGEADHYYDENNVKVYHPYRNSNYTFRSQTAPVLEVSASGSSIDEFYIANANSSYGRCRNIERITANVKSFNPNYKFSDMYNLKHVEFPSGATTGKTNFGYMFNVNMRLKNIPFFDTSSATGVYAMFSNCHSLETIPDYDFSNVNDFGHILHRCYSMEKIPEIDFSNGKNFYQAFSYNPALRTMPSGFSIPAATGARYMFAYNFNLQYLPEFNCPNLTDVRDMFYECRELKGELKVNFPSAYNVSNMAFSLQSLHKITIKGLGSPTDFTSFIRSCTNLKEIDWETSYQNTANGRNFYEAFAYNTSMSKYPLMNTALATGCGLMFRFNNSLRKPPVLDFSSVTNARLMFHGNWSMAEVAFSSFNKCNAESMFDTCYNLRSVSGIFKDYDTTPYYVRNMFYNCYFLEDVSDFVISGVTNTSTNNNRMFYNCYRLKKPPKIINTQRGLRNAFERCQSLESIKYDLSTSEDNVSMFHQAYSIKNVHLSGVKASIGFDSCLLGSGDITRIFNDLATVSSATVDIRRNYGIELLHSDTMSIATNKGWTVTT